MSQVSLHYVQFIDADSLMRGCGTVYFGNLAIFGSNFCICLIFQKMVLVKKSSRRNWNLLEVLLERRILDLVSPVLKERIAHWVRILGNFLSIWMVYWKR